MESVLNMKTVLQNKFYGALRTSLYLKAIVKCICSKNNSVPRLYKHPKILTIISIILWLILSTSLVICSVYKLIVNCILKLKFKSKYRGLLEGTDSIFVIQESEHSRSVVTILFFIDFKGNGKEFCEATKAEIVRIFSLKKLEKLLWTKHTFLGYFYYKLRDLDWNHFISDVDCDNLEELNECLAKLSNRELPLGDSALWDVSIGRKFIGARGFPLIFRFHHCFGDAVTIFNLFSRDFNKTSSNSCKNDKKKEKLKLRPVEDKYVNNPFIKMFSFDEEPDRSLYCGMEISGNKYLVWYAEEYPKYLPMIKDIKKKFGSDITFMNVVLTALSASLNNYAKQKTDDYPTILSAVLTMFPTKTSFDDYGDEEIYELNNKFTVGVVKLPLKLEDTSSKKDDLIQRFHNIKQDYHELKYESLDFAFNRWQAVVCLKYFPYYLSRKYVRSYEPTLLLSNIPGCSHLDFLEDSSVNDFIVFDPNISTSGISLMLTSYEGRLNFGFTIDKSVVADRKDAEWICKDMLKSLEELHNI